VDGTLVDSNDAHAHAWVEAFAVLGIEVPYEAVRRRIGMGADKLMPAVASIEEDSPRGQALSEERSRIFRARYLPHLRPFPDTRALIERFLHDGFSLAIASSAKEDELDALLEVARVSDLIPARTSSDDADRSKPDPDVVRAALRQVKGTSVAVMIGDTPYDLEAAERAGIEFVGVECGGWRGKDLAGAAAIYRDPADLLSRYESSLFARTRRGGSDV
jgi:phosphoglycolate phosphatase-like HAD superfamily hydrolase